MNVSEAHKVVVDPECPFCGAPVYIDQPHYRLANGYAPHSGCLEQFARTGKAKGGVLKGKRMPAKKFFKFISR